jgi:hypothetical protein
VTKQPHLDYRALHRFYGSSQHYMLLLLLSFLLIIAVALFSRELYRLHDSRLANAQLHHHMAFSALSTQQGDEAAFLLFSDPDFGEIRYRINDLHDEKLKIKLSEIASYWEVIPIRYQIDATGDVYRLDVYSLGGTLMWILLYTFSGLGLMIALYRLSPRPYWYWKNADAHFQRLAREHMCLDVRVEQLNEVGLTSRRANRLCSLTGSVYIHIQNVYINVESPYMLVEPQFRMSYPIMKVYFNPKNLKNYEVDLYDFLKNNGSSLHGFASQHPADVPIKQHRA